MEKTEVWKKWQLDMKAWRKKRDHDLRIICAILIPLNIIIGCCSFYFSSRVLDAYLDRRELEDYPSDGSLELNYNIFFCSMTTYIVCTLWLPVCYAFNMYRRFLPFIQVVCVIAPVQFFSTITAYCTLSFALPTHSIGAWEELVAIVVSSSAFILSFFGNFMFLGFAFTDNGEPEKMDIKDIIEMEMTKKEKENERLKMAREQAQKAAKARK